MTPGCSAASGRPIDPDRDAAGPKPTPPDARAPAGQKSTVRRRRAYPSNAVPHLTAIHPPAHAAMRPRLSPFDGHLCAEGLRLGGDIWLDVRRRRAALMRWGHGLEVVSVCTLRTLGRLLRAGLIRIAESIGEWVRYTWTDHCRTTVRSTTSFDRSRPQG